MVGTKRLKLMDRVIRRWTKVWRVKVLIKMGTLSLKIYPQSGLKDMALGFYGDKRKFGLQDLVRGRGPPISRRNNC